MKMLIGAGICGLGGAVLGFFGAGYFESVSTIEGILIGLAAGAILGAFIGAKAGGQ